MSEPLITSLHNARVKEAAHLRRHRQRAKQRRILIDGGREILRALASGVPIDQLFVCEELCRSEAAAEATHRARAAGVEVLRVTSQVFAKLAFGERDEGLVALAPTPHHGLATLALPEDPLVVVLAALEKPGNIGAILRSADAAGVSAVIVADPQTDLYNPNTIRASLGTIFSLPIAMASASATLDFLRARQLGLYAARVGMARNYTEVDLARPSALILGSEAEGLKAPWLADDIQPISLPMLGIADSLNVSATAAVLFYEALRQRGTTTRHTRPQ